MRAAPAALLLIALLLASARAEEWTVQTVALRDFRDAQARVASLRTLGFDAYTEFAMDDGLQFTRVRVGCFTTRQAALAMAQALAPALTAAAVPVPMTPGAKVLGCATVEVGFLTPATWRVAADRPDFLAFEVGVGGRTAFVTHDGHGWAMAQTLEAPAGGTPAGAPAFLQLAPSGVSLVAARRWRVALCAGRILWQTQSVAVVEQEDAVVACSFAPAARPAAPTSGAPAPREG